MWVKAVGRKSGWSLVTLWFVLSFNFFLFRIMPGDPIALLARSQRLSPAALIEQRRILGLDQALPLQYVTYLRQTLSGNLGVSMISGTPVTSIIGSRIWPTVLLVGVGTTLAIILGVIGGIAGGWNRGSSLDRSSLYGSMVLYSTPEGWLGMLVLIVLAGTLGWFPAGGYSSGAASGMAHVTDVAKHLVLPVITLTLSYVGQFLIVMRSSLVDIKEEEFIAIARAKGLTDAMVRRRHAVPNAFLPSFTLIVLSFGFVLGGAIVIETVFSWPGLGLLTYQAIQNQDYPVLQAIFLLSSSTVIVANLLADLTYRFLDPRVEVI